MPPAYIREGQSTDRMWSPFGSFPGSCARRHAHDRAGVPTYGVPHACLLACRTRGLSTGLLHIPPGSLCDGQCTGVCLLACSKCSISTWLLAVRVPSICSIETPSTSV